MCGIAGVIARTPADPAVLRATAERMTAALTHRGPDDGGVWCDDAAGMALGHRRLAVLDPGPGGHQPMVSACGRYVLSYNGEVYNYRALRAALPGVRWRGHSDAEVLLEACAAWGVERALERAAGMWAFALWDRHARRLTLARDRLGIKPLCYAVDAQQVLFASELRALAAAGGLDTGLDPQALAAYLNGRFVPEPFSIFRGARKLEPGCIVDVDAGGMAAPRRYWSLRALAAKPRQSLTAEDAAAALDELLATVVGEHRAADVPLGSFLSGGLDSATVTAYLQAGAGAPVQSFTVGFDDPRYDEAPAARELARAIGTRHTEVRIGAPEALAAVTELAAAFDEPFGDSAALPTLLLARAVRPHLTVVLTGDGGDEVFGGYGHYRAVPARAARLAAWPSPLRGALAAALAGGGGLLRRAPAPAALARAGHALSRRAAVLSHPDPDSLYRRAVYKTAPLPLLGRSGAWQHPALHEPDLARLLPDARERMAYYDTVVGLPGRMLAKVDRASMRVGLEARVPLLDHRVVEFAWSLPPAVRFAAPKGVLRDAAARHLPRALLDRPKHGFRVPVAQWLRGPLRAWAQDLLAPARLRRDGYLDAALVGRYLREHLRGVRNWHQPLWSLLMFEAWRDSLRDAAPATPTGGPEA